MNSNLKLLLDAGWSIAKIADELGVYQFTVERWIARVHEVSPSKQADLAYLVRRFNLK